MSERKLTAEEQAELDALISEQESDAQWGDQVRAPRVPHNMRAVSLDYTFEEGASAGEVIGQQDTDLRAVVGGEATYVRKIARPQKWTKPAIIAAIKAWVKEHGELPFYGDWNYPNGRGIPSSASIARAFGSWNAGIRAAGFEPRGIGSPRQKDKRSQPRRIREQKVTARLTSTDLAAAYVLYDRHKLSIPELADRLWQQYGYPTPRACQDALNKGFHAEGFRLRTKSEARMCLSPEKRQEIARAMRRGRYGAKA